MSVAMNYRETSLLHQEGLGFVSLNSTKMHSQRSPIISAIPALHHIYKTPDRCNTVESGKISPGAEGKAGGAGLSKCRQLPCRTFISTGSCPYGDRCVFLHDPCIASKPVLVKIKVHQSLCYPFHFVGTSILFLAYAAQE